MDSLIHQRFPLPAKNDTGQAESELSYTEENALRYASGYVVRSVFEDIQKRNHDSQSALLEVLIEICQSEHATRDSSEEWLQSVDRGGLIHISQTAYRFFYDMEMEVRKHLRHTDEHLSYDVTKNTKTVKEYVLEDVDVQYNWGLCSCQLEEEETDELLKKIHHNQRIFVYFVIYKIIQAAKQETFAKVKRPQKED